MLSKLSIKHNGLYIYGYYNYFRKQKSTINIKYVNQFVESRSSLKQGSQVGDLGLQLREILGGKALLPL